MAEILSLTERRVQQLVAAKLFVRNPKTKKFSVPDCVSQYMGYKSGETENQDINYQIEHARLEKAKRKKAELEVNQLEGRLLDSDAVELFMSNIIINAKTKLRGTPVKIAPLLQGETDLDVIEDIILRGYDDFLLELSKCDLSFFNLNTTSEINGSQ